jgi:two-component system, OmpR family, response regulator
MRLLLVEDDLDMATCLAWELRQAGFAVDHAATGEEGSRRGIETAYDAVILDLGLPDRTGFEVLRGWRAAENQAPVLILSARDTWRDKVDGLKLGADDYLGKPFRVEELVARIQALIRRSGGLTGGAMAVAGLRLDAERRQILLGDGQGIELTGTEFRMLRYFMLNAGKVLSKSHLSEHVFDQDAKASSNLIEVYIKRLRQKIGADRIRTLRGQGYLFVAEA